MFRLSCKKWVRAVVIPLSLIPALYVLALIPEGDPPAVVLAQSTPFEWNQDAYWHRLQLAFELARGGDCAENESLLSLQLTGTSDVLDELASGPVGPKSPQWAVLEEQLFELAAQVAACPGSFAPFEQLVSATRSVLKDQSRAWDINNPVVKSRLYRLLYGGRMALEEVMLQQPEQTSFRILAMSPPRSETPFAVVHGVQVHSGDLLVSRGGAPTSALISRGNDYPGNFSHVALVHVDATTGAASIIEAHIERGVAVATVDEYLSDTKLRIMLLRLRHDLPQISADPLLPHKAATQTIERARTEHVPYDFAMNFDDPSRLFCSEVASAAYRQLGLELWMNLSSISGATVVAWLRSFGVRHFKTQAPSDLEYDPQLVVVAEWRDLGALRKDHLDDAVIDALLEEAHEGSRLDYNRWMLPLGRLAKLYSVVLNLFGAVGPIPEGMSATAALMNQRFTVRHQKVASETQKLAAAYKQRNGYLPPYWELVSLARQAVREGAK